MIKIMRIRCVGHMAQVEKERNAYKVVLGNLKEREHECFNIALKWRLKKEVLWQNCVGTGGRSL
jgi:hypothetical protein